MSYALRLDKLPASAAIPLAMRCNDDQEFTRRARIAGPGAPALNMAMPSAFFRRLPWPRNSWNGPSSMRSCWADFQQILAKDIHSYQDDCCGTLRILSIE